MDVVWILVAFICGLFALQFSLPPLIGFLAAGFVLNFFGVEQNALLDSLANIGITLMLFTIGLKLRVSDLIKKEVWGGTLSHLILWCLALLVIFSGLALLPLADFSNLSWTGMALIAFALSFSSTVCVIKLLEDNGELKTRHGTFAICVLVIQDIAAVVFLVFATGKVPSLYAPLLVLLLLAAPLLRKILERVGHDEMLPLTGFLLALGGYQLFEAFSIKGDLGALLIGTLLSGSTKAAELSKSLLSFKDIFLIGFFLSIGLTALPTVGALGIAVAITLLLVLKFFLFLFLLGKFNLRARTSFLSALSLSNYSEFGLIVAYISVQAGWLSDRWLVVLALATVLSFMITSVLYPKAHMFYARYKDFLKVFESGKRLPEDLLERPPEVEMLVIGLGRVGRGAFNALYDRVGNRVWGMDSKQDLVKTLQRKGLHVFAGDGESADLWEIMDATNIKLVLLAMPAMQDCANVVDQLKLSGFNGSIAAIARYEDDRQSLLNAGVNHVFNFFTEAGVGFAEDSLALITEPLSTYDTQAPRR